MPYFQVSAEAEPCKHTRLDHRDYLCHQHHPVTAPAVNENAGKGGQQKRGYRAGKTHNTQQHLGVSHTVDNPGQRYPLHPGANQRNTLPAEKQPVITVTE